MSTLPEPLREHLEQLCVKSHSPAYFLVSRDGLVLKRGGEVDHYGLADVAPSRPVGEHLDVLHGLLPLEGQPLTLPFVQLPNHVYAEIHGVPSADGDWVILLDSGAEAERQQTVQQAMNNLALLQRRESKLLARVERDHADLLAILDQLDVMTVVLDADGRIDFISRRGEELLARTRRDLIGESWRRAFPFADDARETVETALAAPGGDAPPVRCELAVAGRRRYWLELHVRHDPRDSERRLLYGYDISDVYDLRALLQDESTFAGIVGGSAVMQQVFRMIRELAGLDTTVLISGETGTGKELTARAIHYGSRRRDAPFIVVNSAGLSDSLINSELFGHRKGAFTGADANHEGVFEAADGGTILLDEIGDIPMNTQTRILRVLEEREVVRIGETRPRPIDIRVVAATNKDLDEEVRQGRFRQDLLYRVRVARVELPPLRERRQDIPLLVDSFLRRSADTTGKAVEAVGKDTMQYLTRYAWPGNVRELRNAIEYAIIACRGSVLQPGDLPPEITAQPAPSGPRRPYDRDSEKDRILEALDACDGNRAAAAKRLGISRATLYRRMKSCF